MTRARKTILWSSFYIAAAALFATGCEQPTNSSSTVVTPTPEESFEVIMAEFRRHIEDTPTGFVSEKGGERSRLLASNKVSSKLIPPAQEGAPYRAEVTVLSEARYSLQRQVEEPEDSKEDDKRGDKDERSDSSEESTNNFSGLDILDPGLVKSSKAASDQGDRESSKAGESVITRREEKDKRTFELEYTNGRWKLLTVPDPETERAIDFAFQKSLATQI